MKLDPAISEAISRATRAAVVLAWYVILATVLGVGIIVGIPRLVDFVFGPEALKLFDKFYLSYVFDAMGLFAVVVIMGQGGMEAVRVFRMRYLAR